LRDKENIYEQNQNEISDRDANLFNRVIDIIRRCVG